MFSEEDLRDLAEHLMTQARDIERKEESSSTPPAPVPQATTEEPPADAVHLLRKLARLIEAVRYNPLLFEDILEEYDIHADPLAVPLDDTPLHINDEAVVSKVIVKWRLNRGV